MCVFSPTYLLAVFLRDRDVGATGLEFLFHHFAVLLVIDLRRKFRVSEVLRE
jgi:hypothetical protein